MLMMDRLGHHLRLALRDVRRNPGLSLAIFVGLALASCIWSTANCHYLRLHGGFPPLSPALHQVELRHPRTPTGSGDWGLNQTGGLVARTQVSYPEYRVLAGSGIPARQAASMRARTLVARGPTDAALALPARFVQADFFQFFPIPLRGRPFTGQDDQQSRAVAVIGYRAAQELFPGGDAVGATVMVDGHPFLIVGAVADHGPMRPVWDIAMTGGKQDALYLPFSWWQRLLARPEVPLTQVATGARFDDLLRAPTLFISFWLELPTEASRQAYRAYLDRHLGGPDGPGYELRDFPTWAAAFEMPFSDIRFFTILTGLVLLGGGFNASRLLLAKGVARRSELGIHRALGASRMSIFARQMSEAALLAVPAALLGILLAVPYNGLFNRLVEISDVPVRMTLEGFARGFIPAVLVGVAAAIYPAWRLSQTGPMVQVSRF
jgi:putative ABC transport system permease protein